MKQKVLEYLEEHPKATTDDLRKVFPGANKKSLWNYSGQWKKQKGIKKKETADSIRGKVFEFFNNNPNASLGDLRKAFPKANEVSISNYRYQWKKKQIHNVRNPSIKEQVFNYIKKHPEITFGELKRALPDINPSSVSAYHSQWKKSQAVITMNPEKPMKQQKNADRSTKNDGNEQELIKALKATIEAQKDTIDAMKAQNSMLKNKQSAIISEFDDITDSQMEEIKKIMKTYIKGMRKL